MNIKRILVPVDGSEGGQAALDHAIGLLDGHAAELLVTLAIEPIPLRLGAQVTLPGENVRMLADEQRLIAEDRLAQLEGELRERGLAVRTLIGTGAANDVILGAARKHTADMIVMATHARTGIAHALLGSIAEKVIRGAACPVLTVRRKPRRRSRREETAMKIARILVPVDFSRHSLKALAWAIDFAEPFGAAIDLVHVVEPIAYATPADLYAGMATQLGNLLAEQRRSARQQLDELAAKYAKRGVSLRIHLRDGIAYREIVDAAKQLNADLVVQATHGRTGLSHVLLGSVAERVVRTSECPVLTIRTTAAGTKKRPAAAKKKAATKKSR